MALDMARGEAVTVCESVRHDTQRHAQPSMRRVTELAPHQEAKEQSTADVEEKLANRDGQARTSRRRSHFSRNCIANNSVEKKPAPTHDPPRNGASCVGRGFS